jgi:hypothetical protein
LREGALSFWIELCRTTTRERHMVKVQNHAAAGTEL